MPPWIHPRHEGDVPRVLEVQLEGASPLRHRLPCVSLLVSEVRKKRGGTRGEKGGMGERVKRWKNSGGERQEHGGIKGE